MLSPDFPGRLFSHSAQRYQHLDGFAVFASDADVFGYDNSRLQRFIERVFSKGHTRNQPQWKATPRLIKI